MNNSARGKAVIFLFLTGLGNFAMADEYHYNNLLIGDRASGMGGAYTAVSDDATGMYYNPAGIVYVGDKNFSASVNAYYSQSKKYDNVFGNQSFERNSSALLANYFGIVKPFGKYKVGFSYAVPDAVSEDQNQSFTNVNSLVARQTFNLSNRDTTYNIGPSIAREVNDDLSVGLTMYMHFRRAELIVNQFVERVDTSSEWINNYFRLNETGVKPIFGVSWSPAERISVGASMSRTFVLSSSTTQQITCWDDKTSGTSCPNGATNPTVQVPTLSGYNYKREYPTHLALGVAWFPSSSLLVSGDVSYNTAVNDPIYGNKVATYNAAVGTEYYLSRKWAVRAGLFTNMANTGHIQAGVTQIEEHIDLYGVSLSLSNFSGSSSVTVGGSFSYGTGQSQILDNTSVQSASTLGWLVFLSSSY